MYVRMSEQCLVLLWGTRLQGSESDQITQGTLLPLFGMYVLIHLHVVCVCVCVCVCDCVLQAMSERTKEIDMHKEMVQAETKTAEAERQTARYVCG